MYICDGRLAMKHASQKVLRTIIPMKEATARMLTEAVGFKADPYVNSLARMKYIEVIRTQHSKNTRGSVVEVNVYAVTRAGLQKLYEVEHAPPPKPKPPPKAENKKPPELHLMTNFVIPDRNPNVNEMMAEIGGRQVKITYGVHHAYEPYVPPPDHSRNYTPRPIKGIHAL